MSSNKKQLLLFLIGIFLVIVTYVIYPRLTTEKIAQQTTETETGDDISDTIFEDVQYDGFDANGNRFEISSKTAEIKSEDADITYMKIVTSYFYLKDGRIVKVSSKLAVYNKKTNDIFFSEQVEIDDGESQLYCNNLDVITSHNTIKAYNNVRFNENTNLMTADKIEIDLDQKISKISMYGDEQIKIKLTK